MGRSAKLVVTCATPAMRVRRLRRKSSKAASEGDEDAQLIVCLAGHQIAVHHFGKFGDRAFEGREVGIILLIEPDAHESVDGQADGFRLHQRDIAGDDPALFQRAHAAQARAGAEADIFAQLLVGEAAIVLEAAEDLAVYRVEIGIWHYLSLMRK